MNSRRVEEIRRALRLHREMRRHDRLRLEQLKRDNAQAIQGAREAIAIIWRG